MEKFWVHEWTSVRVVGYVNVSRLKVCVVVGIHVPRIVAHILGMNVRIDIDLRVSMFLWVFPHWRWVALTSRVIRVSCGLEMI